ncbi:amidohydrolase family protein [Pseudonocardia xinjiangensis]|uniref:amidohydrolase family protein n=1 Tax=Pseudonocardia xinjiangensis TaxID=75289 RepID=UPI003D914729
MIIDLHRHLWSIFERYAAVREIAARGLVGGVHQHADAPVQDVGSRAAEIRAEMDKAGVDRSCLLLGDYGLRLGEGDLSIEAENRLATDLAREDPEHFIAFFGIDPRRPGAVELFRDALDAGARGLKLHPCSGYSPSDPVCRPLYALAGERGVPVAVHTGPMAAPLVSTYASPIHLDEPAADFPDTTFVILHAGQRAWFPLALDMARWKPNLYLELSLWQGLLLEDEARFVGRIGEIKSGVGLGRVVFGSDCPGVSSVMPLHAWVETFRRLPEIAQRHGVEVTPDEVDQMLGTTAASLMGLS